MRASTQDAHGVNVTETPIAVILEKPKLARLVKVDAKRELQCYTMTLFQKLVWTYFGLIIIVPLHLIYDLLV